VVNGVVYVGSDDGKLYAFDAAGNSNCSGVPKTCAPLWTGSTGRSIFSSPAVVNGVVYIGSDDGNLYAFDAAGNTNCAGTPKACAPLWTAPVNTGIGVEASPTVSNGIVYVGSSQGGEYAFDAAGNTNCSGVPKVCTALWTYDMGGTSSSAAVVNGVLYVGNFLSSFEAFDAAGKVNCSGTPYVCEPLWTAPINSSIGVTQSPAVAHGAVYVGDQCNFGFPSPDCANPPHFYAFDAATGATRWTAMQSSTDIPSSAAVANGLVFVGTSNGVSAYDAAGHINCSGTPIYCSPLWTEKPVGGGAGDPVVANGMVYVGSGDGNLYVYGLPPH
jgi:outer membrane protein assembly factor BamB